MGKILAYLGKDEKHQPKDILEAERLLEGMQMLYAAAQDGAKKDFLAVSLSEMTRTFIEKVNGAPEEEEEFEEVDLPFKEGDAFMIASEFEDPIHSFTIKSINFDDNTVTYQSKNLKDKKIAVKRELIVDVAEYIENGFWITFQNVRPQQKPEIPKEPEPEPPIPQPEPNPIPVPEPTPPSPKPEKKTKRKVDTEKQRIIKEVLNIDLDNIDI